MDQTDIIFFEKGDAGGGGGTAHANLRSHGKKKEEGVKRKGKEKEQRKIFMSPLFAGGEQKFGTSIAAPAIILCSKTRFDLQTGWGAEFLCY